ncbi:MAG: hypothetical protein Q9184_002233 [Pyrenodesmia sp. 2 TL-2023]
MSEEEQAVARLVELTQGPAKYFEHLMTDWDGDLDLERYVLHAARKGDIKPEKANVVNLILMLDTDTTTCEALMEGHSDINTALSAASRNGYVPKEQAAPGRLADVCGITSTEARKYLTQTVPANALQVAVTYLKNARRITNREAATALLRLATLLTKDKALTLLDDNAVQGNITKAINLAHQQGHLNKFRYVIAHLFYRFDRTEDEAALIGQQPDVMWNLDKAVIETKIRIVSAKAIVDRKDAFEYLDQTKGDIEKALQLIDNAQGRNLIFNGDNGDTRCPPNVTSNTHVVAVLGVADGLKGAASPREDGWMVSDFYLWKHLLKGMGKTQHWMTCEPPKKLISRYGMKDNIIQAATGAKQISWKEGYVHGDPFEERRVVLDEALLPDAEHNLTVTTPGISLRDAFLKRVGDTCREAEARNEPVLVMIFSHGDVLVPELGGLVIGIDPDTKNPNDFLNPRMFIDIYNQTPKVHMSMFMTSCHSGHWVVTPRFAVRRPTVMAGAHAQEETFGWAPGVSQRHAGGVYTSAFMTELLKEPPELPKGSDAAKVRKYEELSKAILAEANRLCIPAQREKFEGQLFGSLPLFTTAGANDYFYERSNMQLHWYKANFDQLRRIPASDPQPFLDKKHDYSENDPVVKAWEMRNPAAADPEFNDRTGGYGATQRGLRSSTKTLALRYLSSFPGDDSMAKNIRLHNMIRDFFGGMLDDDTDAMQNLRSQLLYRLWMMQKANEYRDGLNLNKLPPVHQWDGRIPDKAYAQKFKEANFDVILEAGIFRRPEAADGANWGQAYLKPVHYLAHAFAASGYGPDEVSILLQLMAERNKAAEKKKANAVLGSKRLAGSISDLKDLMGGKSPKKRHRSSLSQTGWMT